MKTLMMLVNLLNLYQVIWTNTEIEIPLNENTYQYYEVPKAYLSDGNKVLNIDEYYYERGVNRTSLTVVNSNHVKEFKIDYRITFYELGIVSEQTITFKIIDEVAPNILKVPSFKFPLNTKIPTEKVLLEDFYYEDNYYDNKDLIAKVNNLSNININKVGIYEIEYEVMDPSFNTTTKKTTYEVFDNLDPEIIYDDEIKHLVNTDFSVYQYFKFKGNNLIVETDTSKINFNKIGIYPITVRAINQSGRISTITTNVKIIDNIKPVIKLKSNIIDIDVYTNVDEEFLLEYILSVSDNYDILNKKDVLIITDLNTNILGRYFVTYQVSDSSNNYVEKTINVSVKDLKKPEVVLLEPLIFNVGLSNVYYFNYFLITDNYDLSEDLVINFNDKAINYQIPDVYYLTVSVTDLSKNSKTLNFLVEIKDLIPPSVEQKLDIFVYDFIKPNYDYLKNHFVVSDNYDDYLKIKMDVADTYVNYDLVGMYPLIISFSDQSNNITLVDTFIYILDIEEPRITLKQDVYYYFIDDNKIDLKGLIKSVSDNYNALTLDDVIIKSEINYNEVGLYKVIYELNDSSNNLGVAELLFYIDLRKEALIEGTDVLLNINEVWNPYVGIILSDQVIDKDYFNPHIDTSKPGIYEVIYVVSDKRGNSEMFIQTVEVINNLDNGNNNYLILSLLTIGYVVALVVIYMKDRLAREKYFDNNQ